MVAIVVPAGGSRADVFIDTAHLLVITGFKVVVTKIRRHWVLLILGVHRWGHAEF